MSGADRDGAGDFAAHNAEAREVWAAYDAGDPIRVPMMLGTSSRIWLGDPALNTGGVTWERYHTNARTMLEVQLACQRYRRFHLYADHEMGPPGQWSVHVDGGNFAHSAWYGSPIFWTGDSPDTEPILSNDNRRMLFDRGIPDPFSGVYGEFRSLREEILDLTRGYEYEGRSVSREIGAPPANTMGNGIPFTTACKLRGTAAMCEEMLVDPDYAMELLDYITTAAIAAIRAWRAYLGVPERSRSVLLGDDSVVLLSPSMYREMILPFHRRVYEAFSEEGAARAIHLCGDAQRHFPVIVGELGVTTLDTGYPLDIASLYREIGPGVRVQGGVRADLLREGTPDEVVLATRAVLAAARPNRRFVLRDANLLAPQTPPANVRAMYETCRKEGGYR